MPYVGVPCITMNVRVFLKESDTAPPLDVAGRKRGAKRAGAGSAPPKRKTKQRGTGVTDGPESDEEDAKNATLQTMIAEAVAASLTLLGRGAGAAAALTGAPPPHFPSQQPAYTLPHMPQWPGQYPVYPGVVGAALPASGQYPAAAYPPHPVPASTYGPYHGHYLPSYPAPACPTFPYPSPR